MEVTLIAAQTIDGYIARTELDRSFDWTSPEDKAFYISKLKESDAVIMGSKTFGTFTRYPKGKHFVILTRKPAEFVNPSPEVITVDATDAKPQQVLAQLQNEGYQHVLVAGGSSVYRQYLAAGVVDRLFLTVEPVIFGAGVKLCDEALNAGGADGMVHLDLQKVHQLSSQTIVLEYLKK